MGRVEGRSNRRTAEETRSESESNPGREKLYGCKKNSFPGGENLPVNSLSVRLVRSNQSCGKPDVIGKQNTIDRVFAADGRG